MSKCLHSHHVTCDLASSIFCQYNSFGDRRWLKLINYVFYWMVMRSLEEKVAFCLYNKVQKGPGPYYALQSSQRDKPVKKFAFKIKKLDFEKLGISGVFRQI